MTGVIAILGGSGGAAGSLVGPSNAVYVDVAGNDAFGQRGNAARPFLTIAAALAECQTGDELLIGPGTFAIAAGLTTPATCTGLVIRGSGTRTGALGVANAGGTVLQGAAGIDVLTLHPNLRYCLIQDVDIRTSGVGAIALTADGTGEAGAYMSEGLLIQESDFVSDSGTPAVSLSFVNFFRCTDMTCTDLTIDTCSVGILDTCTVGGAVSVDYDSTDVNVPTTVGRGFVIANAGTTLDGTLTLRGQGSVELTAGSFVRAIAGNTLVSTGGIAPRLRCQGQVGNSTTGGIDFYSAAATQLPDTATAILMDFTGASLRGANDIGWRVAGAAANRQSVNLRGAQIASDSPRNIQCGAGVDIRAMVSYWDRGVTTPVAAGAGGTFLPPSYNETLVAGGAGNVVFTYPVPAPVSAAVYAQATANALATDPFVATRTVTATTVTAAAAGDIDVLVTFEEA